MKLRPSVNFSTILLWDISKWGSDFHKYCSADKIAWWDVSSEPVRTKWKGMDSKSTTELFKANFRISKWLHGKKKQVVFVNKWSLVISMNLICFAKMFYWSITDNIVCCTRFLAVVYCLSNMFKWNKWK